MKNPLSAACLLVALTLAAPCVAASEVIAQKAGCTVCHAKDKKLLGPNYKEIAAKYKGDAGALAKLSTIVRAGGKGVWGQVPMPASDSTRISDADLRSVLSWILKQ